MATEVLKVSLTVDFAYIWSSMIRDEQHTEENTFFCSKVRLTGLLIDGSSKITETTTRLTSIANFIEDETKLLLGTSSSNLSINDMSFVPRK
mgnify:CR=1 FL=1